MSYISLGCPNPAGYCYYHKTGLSVKQIKRKQCIQKQCNRFKKLDHDWWAYRKYIKEKRKEK